MGVKQQAPETDMEPEYFHTVDPDIETPWRYHPHRRLLITRTEEVPAEAYAAVLLSRDFCLGPDPVTAIPEKLLPYAADVMRNSTVWVTQAQELKRLKRRYEIYRQVPGTPQLEALGETYGKLTTVRELDDFLRALTPFERDWVRAHCS